LDANLVELDPRFTKEDLKERKREKKDPLNVKLLRPIPDGEFEMARIFLNLLKHSWSPA